MEDRQLVPAGDMVLAQVQRQVAGQLAKSSRRIYAGNIRAFMEFVGNKPIWEVRREDITAYRDHLIESCASRRTAQARFAMVIRLFHEAMATPEVVILFPGGVNPAARMRGISLRDTAPSPKHRRIDSGAIHAMLKQIPSERDRLIVYFLLYTGVRRAELHKLKVGSIEQAGAYWKATIDGKGSKKREIGIPPHVVEAVQTYVATRPHATADSPLFPALRPNRFNPDWKLEVTPLSPNMIYEIVRRAGQLVGIPNLTAHSTRTTFITTALEAGVPVPDVALHVGHSNINTTMTYKRSDQIVKDSPAYKVRY